MLDRETNDQIRKITSVSCVCINRNDTKWIFWYAKKIWFVLHVFCVPFFFKKKKNTIGKPCNQKYYVNIHSLTCNFTAYNFTQSQIRNKRFFGNFMKFSAELFSRTYRNNYFQLSLKSSENILRVLPFP